MFLPKTSVNSIIVIDAEDVPEPSYEAGEWEGVGGDRHGVWEKEGKQSAHVLQWEVDREH